MAEAEAHELAPDGDVRLICGSDENGNSTHILVSSVVLRLGSPVFKAMLGPHFKEGATLASGARLDLPLPEDDPEAMLAICEVMHMRTPTRSSRSVNSMLEIAITVDKYDCRAAMYYAMENWMQLVPPQENDSDRLHLFIVAYLMEFSKSFATFGHLLVTEAEPDFKFIPPNRIPETLRRAILTLGESRQQLVQEVVSKFEEVIDEECAGTWFRGGQCVEGCTYFPTRLHRFMTKLNKTRLWPLTQSMNRSLQHIFEALEEFPSNWAEDVLYCNGPTFCDGFAMRSDSELVSDLEELRRSKMLEMPLPCLTCAKEEKLAPRGRCTKGH